MKIRFYITRKSTFFTLFLVICLTISSCTHLGERLQRQKLTEEQLTIRDILGDLAANDAAIKKLRAHAKFRFNTSDVGTHKYRGHIAFQSPDLLSVVGRHRMSNIKVMELTCSGNDWILWIRGEELYYKVGEKQSDSFRFSMSEIMREMIYQEEWNNIPLDDVRMIEQDLVNQTALLEIGPEGSPRRRIHVEGLPWIIVKSEILDENQVIRGVVTRSNYHELDQIRFPATVEAEYPEENAHMTFNLTNIRINTDEVKDSYFDIESIMNSHGLK